MDNWGRKIKIDVGNGTFTNEELEIRFYVNFDDDAIPNESKIEIYNLSNSTIAQMKRGDAVTIQAGYGEDIGVLENGKVDKVLTKREGVNKITNIHVIAGDDFSTVKVDETNADPGSIRYHKDGVYAGQVVEGALDISFKPGTDGLTIIKRVTSVLGIKLGGPIILKKNVIYKKGYIITKLILNNLEEVVRDCGSVLYHRRGKLIVRPIDEGTDEQFLLHEDTGLIQSPADFERTDSRGSENKTIRGYSVKCLMQHRITTASIIEIKSGSANGKYRAIKGKHIADADNFHTEFDCI